MAAGGKSTESIAEVEGAEENEDEEDEYIEFEKPLWVRTSVQTMNGWITAVLATADTNTWVYLRIFQI